MNPQTQTSIVVGIFVMYIQRWLKKFSWYSALIQKFPMADKRVHQLIAGVIAFVTAIGVSYTWAVGVDGVRHLTIDIPSNQALLDAAWNWATVYITQNFAYDATRRPAEVVTYKQNAPVAGPQGPAISASGEGTAKAQGE